MPRKPATPRHLAPAPGSEASALTSIGPSPMTNSNPQHAEINGSIPLYLSVSTRLVSRAGLGTHTVYPGVEEPQ